MKNEKETMSSLRSEEALKREREHKQRMKRIVPLLVFGIIAVLIARQEIPAFSSWVDRLLDADGWAAAEACRKDSLQATGLPGYARLLNHGKAQATADAKGQPPSSTPATPETGPTASPIRCSNALPTKACPRARSTAGLQSMKKSLSFPELNTKRPRRKPRSLINSSSSSTGVFHHVRGDRATTNSLRAAASAEPSW